MKGAKTVTQISPQQIVVIKQSDDGLSSDKKHAVLLKQVQPSQTPHRLTLASAATKIQRPTVVDQKPNQLTSDAGSAPDSTVKTVEMSKKEIIEKLWKHKEYYEKVQKQKQLQQLLSKHQNDVKLQQSASTSVAKEGPTIAIQPKGLSKQMIVIKQNPGQIVAETQKVDEETTTQTSKLAQQPQQPHQSSQAKQIGSPLVILNKQQYQQQLQSSKHQIIQLSGQQLTTQQIQQMLLKQQQTLKRGGQQQPQQIVMLKSDVQQQGQQIVMLKQQPQQTQQQLVMIKQAAQQNQKVQAKQAQPQIIQITNNGNIVTDLSKVGDSFFRKFINLLRWLLAGFPQKTSYQIWSDCNSK